MAAYRQVDDLYLLADCLYTRISSGPNARNAYGKPLPFYTSNNVMTKLKCFIRLHWLAFFIYYNFYVVTLMLIMKSNLPIIPCPVTQA